MAEEKKEAPKEEPPIIIKKIVKGGGHHGGAWKVAYADFVTAMMAFFLLLWLLNVSTDEQKNAISNYFDPTHPIISESSISGAGGVMGGLSQQKEGSMAETAQVLASPVPSGRAGNATDNSPSPADQAKEEMRKEEEEEFKSAEEKLKEAIEADPDLSALAENLIIDMTPEGLRIQIIDKDGKPMFASGSARMFDKTKQLVGKVSEIIKEMPNELSIRGHTDSIPYGAGAEYTNWELSSDRANATRRVLKDTGIPEERLNNVVGKADTEHLFPEKPTDSSNRRISIILLKEELTNPDYDKKAEAMAKEKGYTQEKAAPKKAPQIPIGTFRRTPGEIEFP